MNLYRSFGIVGRAWRSVFPAVARPALWVPFLTIAAVQGAALALLVSFHQPSLQSLGVPLVRLLGGDDAVHYPALFVRLPLMYSRADMVLSVLVGSLAYGAATLLFARRFGFEDGEAATRAALRRAPALFLITAITVLALWGLGKVVELVPRDLLLGNRLVRWGTRGGFLCSQILIQSLMAYGTAWVMLEGHSAFPALRDSVRVTVRTFLPTVLLVAIPLLLLYPLNYLAQRVDLVVLKLRPEGIIWVLSAYIASVTLFGFFLVGALTRLFLWRLEAAR
jgi:hypothetical protein